MQFKNAPIPSQILWFHHVLSYENCSDVQRGYSDLFKDGSFIVSNTADFQLVYWDEKTGKLTCPLGESTELQKNFLFFGAEKSNPVKYTPILIESLYGKPVCFVLRDEFHWYRTSGVKCGPEVPKALKNLVTIIHHHLFDVTPIQIIHDQNTNTLYTFNHNNEVEIRDHDDARILRLIKIPGMQIIKIIIDGGSFYTLNLIGNITKWSIAPPNNRYELANIYRNIRTDINTMELGFAGLGPWVSNSKLDERKRLLLLFIYNIAAGLFHRDIYYLILADF